MEEEKRHCRCWLFSMCQLFPASNQQLHLMICLISMVFIHKSVGPDDVLNKLLIGSVDSIAEPLMSRIFPNHDRPLSFLSLKLVIRVTSEIRKWFGGVVVSLRTDIKEGGNVESVIDLTITTPFFEWRIKNWHVELASDVEWKIKNWLLRSQAHIVRGSHRKNGGGICTFP